MICLDHSLGNEVEQRLLLLAQSRDGIVTIDQNGKVYEANQQFANMLGYSLEETHQLYVWDWDALLSKEKIEEKIHRIDEFGEHFETIHLRRDGSCYHVDIYSNAIINRGRKFILCICRDITKRKKAEQEREKLIEELQKACEEIKALRGKLPLCSFCKKIRDDKGYWEQVDVYLSKHSAADISHCICPDCMKQHYPDFK